MKDYPDQIEELISLRKQLEQAKEKLIVNEKRQQFFFNESPVAFQALDEYGKLLEVNQAWIDTLGYCKEEVIGHHFVDFVAENVKDNFFTQYLLFKERGKVFGVELEMIKKDGSSISVSFNGHVLCNEKGEFLQSNCYVQNVSEVKKAEQAYLQSEETARVLLNASKESAFLLDVEGHFIEMNDITAQRLGKPAEDLIGKSVFDFLPEEVAEYRKMKFIEICNSRKPYSFVDQCKGLVLDNHIYPIFDVAGNLYRIAIFSKDITVRFKKEEYTRQLSRLNEKLLVMDELSDKLKVITKGVVELFEAYFARIWLVKPCDRDEHCMYWKGKVGGIECKDHKDCLHLLDSSGRYTDLKGVHSRIPYGCLKIGEILAGENTKFITNNIYEEHYDVDVNWARENELQSFAGFKLVSEYGKPVGVFAFFSRKKIDHTEENMLDILANTCSYVIQNFLKKEALRKSTLSLGEAVKAANVGLWEWDLRTNEVTFSAVWKQQLGYKEHEMADEFKEWESRVHPDDLKLVNKEIHHCIDHLSDSFEVEYRCRHKNGEYRWILAKSSLIKNKHGDPERFIGSHLDITDFKKQEDLLKEANETKDKFLSILAHDLKGPIGSVSETTKVLLDNIDDFSKDYLEKFIDVCNRTFSNVYKLLEDLLTWSRAQRNLITYHKEQFAPSSYFNDVLYLLKPMADNKSITIDLVMDKKLTIEADKETSNIILRNLVSNAIKFTPKKGRIKICGEKILKEKRAYVKISVQDTGIGIHPDKMNKLFKINNDIASAKGTENEKGTGLGLILCKEFVENNGGEIWVESEKNKGATFYFTLPLANG